MQKKNAVNSPCVRNCCLDENDICLGCNRSMQEIMDWHHADDHQKLIILDHAQKRKDARLLK